MNDRTRARRRSVGALAATGMILWAAPCAVGPAVAEELWAVRSGRTVLHLNVDLLGDLGIDLEVTGAAPAHGENLLLEEPSWTFPILPGSELRFRSEHGIVLPEGSAAGAIRLGGTVVLRDRGTGKETRFGDLEIAHISPTGPSPPGAGGTGPLHLRSASTKLVFCELRNSMFDFRRKPDLEIHYLNARLTAAWAVAIGRPDLAGWVIGLGEVRAESERLAATPPAKPPRLPVFAGGLLDVGLGALADIQEVAHVGTFPAGRVALSMSTTACNLGTVDVPWLAPMEENHPVIQMALYRLLGGRLEQIGVSWMKHGFFALSNSQCTPCQNPSGGEFLGVGCSDTYDVGNNSTRAYLGPRSEVNAYQGTWECTGSHFAGGVPDCERRHGSSGHDPLAHRLVAADADLANSGAVYSYEARYMVQGDGQPANNWGHRRCTMSWNGVAWSFTTPDSNPPGNNPLVEGPVLGGWGDASDTFDAAPGDGQVMLAVQTTDLGGGTWHYEYALLNLTSDRQIRSFSLPVLGVANIAGIGFHDNDANAANDWQVTLDGDTITWQTETFAQNPNANALVFGYMYNFRFDADAAPGPLTAALGLYKPGEGSGVTRGSIGPTNVLTAVGDAGEPAARVLDVHPNPFDRSTTIRYQASSLSVDLSVYDAAGRRVRTLVREGQGTGIRSLVWSGDTDGGARVRAGVYYARLRSGSVTAVRSLVIRD
ncbi:MAG: FlgD immunoglobulin-like domain containing protein [Actinomycetota bacterium]